MDGLVFKCVVSPSTDEEVMELIISTRDAYIAKEVLKKLNIGEIYRVKISMRTVLFRINDQIESFYCKSSGNLTVRITL